jgi:soluble lytic murein transglycosylase-like protein
MWIPTCNEAGVSTSGEVLVTPTTGHVAAQAVHAEAERERTQLRRRQWRAIAGAALLISWNGVPSEPSAKLPHFFAEAKPAPEQSRELIIATVQQRNPRLGRGRAERIADSVLRCTESERLTDLTPRLVLSVMFQESAARPSAISPKGAIGLMQVMPDTYRRLDLAGGIAHLESNIEAGCKILADNMRRLGRDRGISSYFWGNVIRDDQYLNGVESIFRKLSDDGRPVRTQTRG